MTLPLMPKATAVWLIEYTSLDFRQIADFCGLHPLEVQAIADGESAIGMVGFDPLSSGQLTQEEISRCEKDSLAKLVLNPPINADSLITKKKKKYTPVSKRHERPDAIAWIVKYYPQVPDSKIVNLLGTTKAMIQSIRTRTRPEIQNIKPKNPVSLGFCTQEELDEVIGASEG